MIRRVFAGLAVSLALLTACMPSSPMGDRITPTGRLSEEPAGAARAATPSAAEPGRQTPPGDRTPEPGATEEVLGASQPPDGSGELSAYVVAAGGTVSYRASGFTPGEEVRIHLDRTDTEPLARLTANDRGDIEAASIQVPAAADGNHRLIAVGTRSRVEARQDFAVLGSHPWVNLDRYALAQGEGTGLRGHAFLPSEQVTVHLDDVATDPIATLKAGIDGQIAERDVLTGTPELIGRHRLILRAAASGRTVEAPLEVLPFYPTVEPSAYAIPPGTEVRFNGRGFAPNETIRVLAGEQQQEEVSRFSADGKGAFRLAGSYTVPIGAPGMIPLTVVGEVSRQAGRFDLHVLPLGAWAGLSAYAGAPGTILTFRGGGFAAAEQIQIYLEDQPVEDVQADEQGGFERAGSYTLPAEAVGRVNFLFRGATSGVEATAGFDVIR